jgi:hydroxymethylpyrimidine/phosphomethylpyrimidine kinase
LPKNLTSEKSSVSGIKTPIALTIAGSDSGGGAGIQADLKAFSAQGVYGSSVITAVTAQNTQYVTAVHDIPVEIVTAQIEAVLSDIDVDAIKIGMLASPQIIQAVKNAISSFSGPIILDPVMVAKSGDKLLQNEAIASLKSELFPLATLLTPNLPEAAVLLGSAMATSELEMLAQGEQLLELGVNAVLMKGGHGAGQQCVDFLIEKEMKQSEFSANRIDTKNTHGTGCTLSSSIAAGMAKGRSLKDAISEAHKYLHEAIKAADDLAIGSGRGPVNHFHQFW